VIGLAGFFGLRALYPNDERLINQRLFALRDDVNSGATETFSSVARAAQIGTFFTEDVVVDLGQGTAPIVGRETLMGMAARLEPRTTAFRLELDDVGARLAPDGRTADVSLTVSFVLRTVSTGGESVDAREFSLGMTKDGVWRIARVTAVDTLK